MAPSNVLVAKRQQLSGMKGEHGQFVLEPLARPVVFLYAAAIQTRTERRIRWISLFVVSIRPLPLGVVFERFRIGRIFKFQALNNANRD